MNANTPYPYAWRLDKLPDPAPDAPRVFSTFSCGGGSSMGYKLAGAHVLGGCDIDPVMTRHYKANLHPELFYTCPIKKLLTAELDPRLFELDILDGSPPCSSFSMAGNREKDWGKNKKFREGQAVQVLDDLFFDYLNLVERLTPKVAIAENVKGMLIGSAKGYTKAVIRRFAEIGYRPQAFLVNGVDCGVPQLRERVFFCAVRQDVSTAKLRLALQHPPITVSAAFAGLAPLTEQQKTSLQLSVKAKQYWSKTLPGTSFKHACSGETGKGSWFTNKRLSANKPAKTLMSSGVTAHYSEPRKISFREACRISGFPDDYRAESESLGYYIAGMCVPPPMTREVARACLEQWLDVPTRKHGK